MDRGAGLGEVLVVPDAVFPASRADAVEWLSGSVGVGEGAAIQRQAHDDLFGADAVRGVVGDGLLGVIWGCEWVGRGVVQVGELACLGAPAAGVVVRHQVPEVEILVHVGQVHLFVVVGSYSC